MNPTPEETGRLIVALRNEANEQRARAEKAEMSCRIKEELLGDHMEILARIRRVLKPTAHEAPYRTDAIAVDRAGLLDALQREQGECLGFLAGLGYEGTLVRATVALADQATEHKHAFYAARNELARIKGAVLPKALAIVEKSAGGPAPYVAGRMIASWVGCAHNQTADELAVHINTAQLDAVRALTAERDADRERYNAKASELIQLVNDITGERDRMLAGIQAYRTGSYTLAQVWENEHGKAVPR